MPESFLFTMHEGLPRQGVGSTACTKKIFSFLPGRLPEKPEILDINRGYWDADNRHCPSLSESP